MELITDTLNAWLIEHSALVRSFRDNVLPHVGELLDIHGKISMYIQVDITNLLRSTVFVFEKRGGVIFMVAQPDLQFCFTGVLPDMYILKQIVFKLYSGDYSIGE